MSEREILEVPKAVPMKFRYRWNIWILDL